MAIYCNASRNRDKWGMPKPQPIVITDVHLDPETEARLNALARFLGRTPEGLTISLLENDLLNGPHREKYLEVKAIVGHTTEP